MSSFGMYDTDSVLYKFLISPGIIISDWHPNSLLYFISS